MMSIGDIAAKLPWPVFACNEDKQPVVATGFKAATRDPNIILKQFSRPGATAIGVPTGTASGLIAIDIDVKPDRDGRHWLDENQDALPQTRTHKTRSGGLHLIFRAPQVEIRNSAGRLGRGVDVRGEGGYIIVPPSPGYAIADNSEPADMPVWLIKACTREEATPPPRPDSAPTDKYAQAALDAEIVAVMRAAEGTRNDTLNTAAVKLGTLVGAGLLSRGTVEAELHRAALMAGLQDREITATIKSGIDFGIRNPREIPERQYKSKPNQRQADEKQARPQDEFLWFADITADLNTRDFVQGVLVEGAAVVIYGASNSGKTFWATNLALHIAAGHEWNGRRVEQGGVLYLAMEGMVGFRNRVAAWKEENGLSEYDLPFAALQRPVNFRSVEDVDALVESVRTAQARMEVPLRAIFVDTLSRAMAGGNENAPDDMGLLVLCMDKLRADTGATVLFIHHTGKDAARGARGHSLLQAAIDTEIEVAVDEIGDGRTATVVKQREMRKGDIFPFVLRVVELGTNRHGEVVTTCVVEAGDDAQRGRATSPGRAAGSAHRRLTGHNKRALVILADLVATSGQGGHPGVPPGYPSIPEKWWRDRFYDRAMPGADEDTKRKAFRRAADALIEAGDVGMTNKRVWYARGGTVMDP